MTSHLLCDHIKVQLSTVSLTPTTDCICFNLYYQRKFVVCLVRIGYTTKL